jgi:glycosyltransferase involved in cell wall biosynthesis
MRLLYLYSEEWTGRRAREVHTLSTCVALAESGIDVTLVTAGGGMELHQHLVDIASANDVPGLNLVALSRTLGPIRSTAIFARNFGHWLQTTQPFDLGYVIHLKAGPILTQAGIPYAYEAHEIFAQTPQNAVRQRKLHILEGQVLNAAALHIATSAPLAIALITWFSLPKDFVIIPNAGLPPLDHAISAPDGPFIYCGSIADWKGLDVAIQAASDAKVPLKIVGGTQDEWNKLGDEIDTGGIDWHPRVPLDELPMVLAGARAGLIPTNPDMPSGEFSCPMKLFDYARCGLQVLTTALPSLQSLDVGPWCTQVLSPTRASWSDALKAFSYDAIQADVAREWARQHTWANRAELLKHAFGLQ